MDNKLIKNLNKYIRKDSYVIDVLDSVNMELKAVEDSAKDLRNQFSFSTMTWGADLLANKMGIKLDPNLTQDVKNSIIAGYWKSDSKCDLNLLQTICNSWKNGVIEVSFQNSKIIITFVGLIGIPEDIDALKEQINKAKPSHLDLEFIFKYNIWNTVKTKTWGNLQTKTWDTVLQGTL